MVSGEGVSPEVKTDGNTISVQGILTGAFKGLSQISVSADDMASGATTAADKVQPQTIALAGLRSPEVHLATVKPTDGPFPVVYESFHYMPLPSSRDLTCTVLKALGDHFDSMVYYSDFRVDNQEAGTPSTGPMGGHVTGIGVEERRPEDYCSAGRFQWQFVQPVYVGAIQAQKESPPGVKPPRFGHLERMTDYNYAMSQVGHELEHRWSAFVDVLINGERIPLGPTHWNMGLQAPAAFPYRRISEASAMGGGVWQDNHDGTYTQLDDDYYTPATGYSALELYLMGLAAPSEVPNFFLLRNLVRSGQDANGNPIYKADRLDLTIQDVIAAEGPRMPPVDKSQKAFNTGFVVVVKHGMKPSAALIERPNAIRLKWMDYFATVTGHRATVTTNPR